MNKSTRPTKTPLNPIARAAMSAAVVFIMTTLLLTGMDSQDWQDNPGEVIGYSVGPLFWGVVLSSLFRKFANKSRPMRSHFDQIVIISFIMMLAGALERVSKIG